VSVKFKEFLPTFPPSSAFCLRVCQSPSDNSSTNLPVILYFHIRCADLFGADKTWEKMPSNRGAIHRPPDFLTDQHQLDGALQKVTIKGCFDDHVKIIGVADPEE
jgi:hypothetical protein